MAPPIEAPMILCPQILGVNDRAGGPGLLILVRAASFSSGVVQSPNTAAVPLQEAHP